MLGLIRNTGNSGVALHVIKGDKDARFSHDWLIENGFTYMGMAWGNRGLEYYQIDTELGTICVVDFKEVWLERGKYEHKFEKSWNEKDLATFLSKLS